MEILVNYILPNVILFGGIYVFSKWVEHAFWVIMCHTADGVMPNLKDLF